VNDDDIQAVVKVLSSDWLTTGPVVEEFENSLSKLIGTPCITVSSGTAALHCAYSAIDLKPGDEVITPSITFIATQATAALFGARIVFADVLSDTGNIDPAAVEAAITPRTKAVVAVDFAGHPADLDELRSITTKYGIYLIEDAAHSLGSTYRDRHVGSIADITTFSFFPTKNVTSGEGGAVASIHPDLLLRAKRFSRQGLIRNPEEFQILSEGDWHQEVLEFGLNYRLQYILCALGNSQLSRLADFKALRKGVFDKYGEGFSNNGVIQIPAKRDYVDPTWHLYPIQVSSDRRRFVFEHLRASGIGVQVNYLPAHRHPVFRDLGVQAELPNAEKFYSREISLPMSASLSDSDLEYIIESVCDAVKK
jgi:dTDP-4-amino-4,6-dideoxygalactose transaminase